MYSVNKKRPLLQISQKTGISQDYCTYIGGISTARQSIGIGIDKITDLLKQNFELYWNKYEDDNSTSQEAKKTIEEIDEIVKIINSYLDKERTQRKSLNKEELDKLEEYMRVIVKKIRD